MTTDGIECASSIAPDLHVRMTTNPLLEPNGGTGATGREDPTSAHRALPRESPSAVTSSSSPTTGRRVCLAAVDRERALIGVATGR